MGLRLSRVSGTWWRIDDIHPDQWDWTSFPEPRHRFDPASGRFRVRYAANQPAAAARERFASRMLTEADGRRWLIALTGDLTVLSLTHQANLDALHLDDRVNTGRLLAPRRGDDLLAVGQHLADAVHDWWAPSPPPIRYRTRSVPRARSLAFTAGIDLVPVAARPLSEATPLVAGLVARHGFTVPDQWLRPET